MQRVSSFIGRWPKSTQEPDVKVVDILKIDMYLLCKIFQELFNQDFQDSLYVEWVIGRNELV